MESSTRLPPGRLKNLGSRLAALDLRTAKIPDKTASPLYATPAFRKWRAIVIRRAGGVCEAPGCGRAEQRMFADHIVEVQDGGEMFDLANGQCLCGSHHTLKTNRERARRHGTRTEPTDGRHG